MGHLTALDRTGETANGEETARSDIDEKLETTERENERETDLGASSQKSVVYLVNRNVTDDEIMMVTELKLVQGTVLGFGVDLTKNRLGRKNRISFSRIYF